MPGALQEQIEDEQFNADLYGRASRQDAMMSRVLLFFFFLFALGVPPGILACEPKLAGKGVAKVEGTRYVLAWRPVPAPIEVSEFFALEIAVCSRKGQPRPSTVRVDAQMPEHRQSMNYRPSVTPQGPGRFLASGLLLHVAGHWELSFDVNAGPALETLRASADVR